MPGMSALKVGLFFLSSFALFRSTLFIHEITHLREGAVPGFSIVWNLLCGIPTLYASFLYKGVHIDHHKRNTYGTPEDGEYLPMGQNGIAPTLSYLAQVFILPFPLVIRFGLLAPLSWLMPPLRRFVLESISSLAINFKAKREIPKGKDYFELLWQEVLSFVWVWFVIYCFYRAWFGWHLFLHWYAMMVLMLLINSIRTLVAHRYTNPPSHGSLSFEDQLLDSVNVEGSILTELWAPVGLRFHALHHLFPNLPYHSLPKAHRKILAQIPADHLYRKTIEPSLFAALKTHYRNTQTHP
jgi:fatty acid desaturase